MTEREDEEGFDMMRTVIIAVCSAGAYLALVIGLTAYCSYRLLMQRRNRKAVCMYTCSPYYDNFFIELCFADCSNLLYHNSGVK